MIWIGTGIYIVLIVAVACLLDTFGYAFGIDEHALHLVMYSLLGGIYGACLSLYLTFKYWREAMELQDDPGYVFGEELIAHIKEYLEQHEESWKDRTHHVNVSGQYKGKSFTVKIS